MEKNSLRIVFSILFWLCFSVGLIPAGGWRYSGYTCRGTFENFGSRADKLLIKLYSSYEFLSAAMEMNEIDLMDMPLTTELIKKWSQPPYNESIKLASYPDFDMYEIDINNNPNEFLGNPPNPNYSNPIYPNPCGVPEFRHALAHLIDREYIASSMWNGTAVPMYTIIPSSQQKYVHPDIRLGGQLENLTHPYDSSEAASILDTAGFPIDPDGWRYWDRNGNETKESDEELELWFYIRRDDPERLELGNWFADQLQSEPIKIHVIKYSYSIQELREPVYIWKAFHLYTGGWKLAVDPEHLILWHIDYYSHPGWPLNFMAVNSSEFNHLAERVVEATSFEEVAQTCMKAQEVFASPNCVGCLPIVCEKNVEAVKRCYTGTPSTPDKEDLWEGQGWNGVVKSSLDGLDNRWSLLKMRPECSPTGDGENMTIRWGFSTLELTMLNPVYAQWAYDWHVLGQIYDSLLVRDPNTHEWMPNLCKNFEIGNWTDPMTGQTRMKIVFYLRDDVYWHDGVKFTAADVRFSLYELPEAIHGSPWLEEPPWWDKVSHVITCDILDPFTVEVLLDIPACIWFIGDIGGVTILPRHLWKPILDTDINLLEGIAPDPNLIGTGPWRLVDYIEEDHVLLAANKPGLTIQTNLNESQPITSTYGYFKRLPVEVDVCTYIPRMHLQNTTSVDLSDPISSRWQEIYPQNSVYQISGWEDKNGDGLLSKGDTIAVEELPGQNLPIDELFIHGGTVNLYIGPVEEHMRKLLLPEYTVFIWPPVAPNRTAYFRLVIRNLWRPLIPNTLYVDQYVWMEHPNGTQELLKQEENKTLPSDTSMTEILGPYILEKCHHKVKFSTKIVGPEEIQCSKNGEVISKLNPWINQWINGTLDFWVTIKEDIAGQHYND